jgi:hypothetical protein
MRKAALLVAVTLAAALSATPSDAATKPKPDPAIAAQKNSADLMRDAFNPYQVASAKSATKHAAKSAKKKSKKAKKAAKK